MAKEIIEVENLTVTTPKEYQVIIKGTSMLFNKMPDLSIGKGESKGQEKLDPLERERMFWREKLYFDDQDNVYMPGENLHQMMKDAAKYWGMKIAGSANKTYTDVVDKGMIIDNCYMGMKKDSPLFTGLGKMVNGNPSKGKKSGAKVYKIRPLLMNWSMDFHIHSFDARLTKPILKTIMTYAGTFVGMGDWRPTYGRFEVVSLEEV